MQLAKLTMLRSSRLVPFFSALFLLAFSSKALAQDNSPYSRFGLGDIAPQSNITTRGLGGISAGYVDVVSINFNNPASYSQFQTFLEKRSKNLSAGRVILDVGLNFDNRTLIQPNTPNNFTSADAFFSYLQVGLPLRKNWGLSFGIRPMTRISYLINRTELLKDPVTDITIDSAITQFRGSGGSYLPSIGTGFAIKNLSVGVNVGYLFGNRENATFRTLIPKDSLLYYSSEHLTSTSYGNVFFTTGLQYKIDLNKTTILRLGASGNWEQNLKGEQDLLRQTTTRNQFGDDIQIDSVYQSRNQRGTIVYPASYKAGFVLQRTNDDNSGWLLAADYTQSKWSHYRFYDQADSTQDSWMVNAGAQLFPKGKGGYFSKVTYRFGFNVGSDYIKVKNSLPLYGISFGMGLPIANFNRLSPNQFSVVNIALEYGKRGNNDNPLKENLFRLSLGFNFTDLWFGKKKYD
jgi:hypothetical protein